MTRFRLLVIILLAVACVASWPTSAATTPPPAGVKWQVLETQHFTFYFYRATEESARRLAGYAEDIHNRLTAELGIQPDRKTHVVITDNTDECNGFTNVFPRQYILLYQTAEDVDGLLGVGDTLLTTFYHEYTHVLQMAHDGGFPERFNKAIRLKLLIPNVFLPMWSVEGLAVYEESLFGAQGRLHSSSWRMMLRADYIDGGLRHWSQAWAGPYSWPYGNVWYLYGSYFTQYLSDRFGRDRLMAFYNDTAADLPFVEFEDSFKTVFGVPFKSVVDEWYDHAGHELDLEVSAIKAQGVREGCAIASFGGRTGESVFAPDGTLYFVRRDYPTPAALMAAGTDFTSSYRVRYFTGSQPAVSHDGRMMAYGMAGTFGDSYYTDLYLLDLRTGVPHRLSKRLRGGDPSWSPDGTELAFIRNDSPNYSLCRVNVRTGRVTPILISRGQEQAFNPSWSPSGSRIAFTRYTPAEGLRVFLVNADGTGLTPLHATAGLRGREYQPTWSPDGKLVFYAADYTGVFNIYACDAETGQVRQVTNVLTGAYEPAVSPDGKILAYSGYTAIGYNPCVMPIEPSKWTAVNTEATPEPAVASTEKQTGVLPSFYAAQFEPANETSRGYSPFSALSLYPSGLSLDIGSGGFRIVASVSGNDVLDFVNYRLTGLWTDDGPGYGLDLSFRTAPFDIDVHSSLNNVHSELDPHQPIRTLANGLAIGSSEGALFAPDDRLIWRVSARHELTWDLVGGLPPSNLLTGDLSLNYGIVRSYRGPVTVSRGWSAGYQLWGTYDPDSGQGAYGQTGTFRLYTPVLQVGLGRLGVTLSQASDSSASYGFLSPGVSATPGGLAWEASASVELPLLFPERGFTVAPFFLHGFNGYTAFHIGQVIAPVGDIVSTIDFGLVTRLQFFELPIDLYTIGTYTITPSADPLGFSLRVEFPAL